MPITSAPKLSPTKQRIPQNSLLLVVVNSVESKQLTEYLTDAVTPNKNVKTRVTTQFFWPNIIGSRVVLLIIRLISSTLFRPQISQRLVKKKEPIVSPPIRKLPKRDISFMVGPCSSHIKFISLIQLVKVSGYASEMQA